MLATEYGGMNDALYELYRLSGDPKHKEVAQLFDETSLFWELANGNDVLNGKHANTTIPKFIGALKRYTVLSEPEYYDQLTQEEKDELPQYLKAAESFWDTVVNHHTYVTGGQQLLRALPCRRPAVRPGHRLQRRGGDHLRDLQHLQHAQAVPELFKVTGKKKYLDYYENTYINAILPSPEPGDRHDYVLPTHGPRPQQGLQPPGHRVLVLHGHRYGELLQAGGQPVLHR